jgi:hypothetical protein
MVVIVIIVLFFIFISTLIIIPFTKHVMLVLFFKVCG